jgi:hypothetical protein
MEIIRCHDCKHAVSFSAASCPHCGSTEPTGPYKFSKKEARSYRIEQRNDNNLVVTTLAFGAIAASYGVLVNLPSVFAATVAGLAYGLLGLLIGAPLAFTVNMVRHRGYFLVPVGLIAALLAYHILR